MGRLRNWANWPVQQASHGRDVDFQDVMPGVMTTDGVKIGATDLKAATASSATRVARSPGCKSTVTIPTRRPACVAQIVGVGLPSTVTALMVPDTGAKIMTLVRNTYGPALLNPRTYGDSPLAGAE